MENPLFIEGIYKHSPFVYYREVINDFLNQYEHEADYDWLRQSLQASPPAQLTDYNIRRAYEKYKKDSQQWRDSLVKSFAAYGCIDNDIQGKLVKLLDLLEFKDLVPVAQLTNRTQVYEIGTVLAKTLSKASPTWRWLSLTLQGCWERHDENLAEQHYSVTVDEKFNRAGDNVSIPGDRIRVNLQTWKLLKALQDARALNRRMSLPELRAITPKASDIVREFNRKTASPHYLKLIDTPNGKKGRGYTLV